MQPTMIINAPAAISVFCILVMPCTPFQIGYRLYPGFHRDILSPRKPLTFEGFNRVEFDTFKLVDFDGF